MVSKNLSDDLALFGMEVAEEWGEIAAAEALHAAMYGDVPEPKEMRGYKFLARILDRDHRGRSARWSYEGLAKRFGLEPLDIYCKAPGIGGVLDVYEMLPLID